MPSVPPPAFEFLLKHEIRARVRPVQPDDAPLFVRGYAALSPESRYRRFFSQAAELSPQQLGFLTRLDHDRHAAWGALDLGRSAPTGIGVARYVALPDRPAIAEVALTIVDRYQNCGAGTLLHACLHLTAAQRGLKAFVYDVLWENRAFLRYLRSLGAETRGTEAGVVSLEMPVYDRPAAVPARDGTALRFARLLHAITEAPPAPEC